MKSNFLEINNLSELDGKIDFKKNSIILVNYSLLRYQQTQEIIKKFSRKTLINGIPNTPNWNSIKNQLLEFPFTNEFNQIISIGGGSVIDFAKVLNALLLLKLNSDEIEQIESPQQLQLKLERIDTTNSEINHICFPTTIGSGSEATQFATVWTDDESVKFSVTNKALRPSLAILCVELVEKLPFATKLYSTLDAISHSCESLISLTRNPESIDFANMSLNLVWPGLTKGFDLWTTNDHKIAQRVSYFGGQAINITRTGICHSISYPLTKFAGVPHGLACSISLSTLLNEYLIKVKRENLEDSFEDGVALVSEKFKFIKTRYNIFDRFREFIPDRKEFESYIPFMRNKQRIDNLYVPFSDDFIYKVLQDIY
jgi:alcohol dehydrogenase class IV